MNKPLLPPRRPYHSLKRSLIIPYVLLIVMLALALTAVYYWSARINTHQFALRQVQNNTLRITNAVQRYLDDSMDVVDAAFPRGISRAR